MKEMNKKTISIKDDNGKEYVFEKPEFECELKFIFKSNLLALVDDKHIVNYFLNTGKATIQSSLANEWNITPIKPKWYEDKSNFPALFFRNGNIDVVNSKTNAVFNLKDGWRLATKAEGDSLYCEGSN